MKKYLTLPPLLIATIVLLLAIPAIALQVTIIPRVDMTAAVPTITGMSDDSGQPAVLPNSAMGIDTAKLADTGLVKPTICVEALTDKTVILDTGVVAMTLPPILESAGAQVNIPTTAITVTTAHAIQDIRDGPVHFDKLTGLDIMIADVCTVVEKSEALTTMPELDVLTMGIRANTHTDIVGIITADETTGELENLTAMPGLVDGIYFSHPLDIAEIASPIAVLREDELIEEEIRMALLATTFA